MGTAHARCLGGCLLGVLLAAAVARGQAASPLELNRIFAADPGSLYGVELNGTVAWSTPLMGTLASTAGTTVDGRGYVWVVDQSSASAVRYQTDGTLDMVVPVPVSLGGWIQMPAVDRDGNCYVAKLEPDPLQSLGFQSHVVKIDDLGNIVWDVDLTPLLASGQPSDGIIDQVRVDEDGNLWATLYDPSVAPTGGGRLVKLDPQGNVLFSIQGSGRGIQVNADRTVRVTQWATPGSQPAYVQYTLEGNPVSQSLNISGCAEPLAHASGEAYCEVVGVLLGPQFGSLPPPDLGYTPLYSGSALGGAAGGMTIANDDGAFGPNGLFWTVAHLTGISNFQQFVTGWSTYVPSSIGYTYTVVTPLGSSNTPWGQGVEGDNRGSRFTAYHWCLVVDPWNDLDGDGVLNRNEIMAGTNPCDPQSVQAAVGISGITIGQFATFSMQAGADGGLPYVSVLSATPDLLHLPDHRAFGPSLADPVAAFWLDPATTLATGQAGVLSGSGAASATVLIPPDPALSGITLHFGFATGDPTWSLGLKTLYGPRAVTISGGSGP